MIDFEDFYNAYLNIKQQGLRSYLTLLGVIIGIAAIVALVSIGEGLNLAIAEQFEKLGANTIFISQGNVTPGSGGSSGTFQSQIRLKDADLSRIERIPEVESVIPFYSSFSPISHGPESASVSVIGFDPEKSSFLEETGFIQIEEGRMLNQRDNFSAIVGKKFATDTFKKELNVRGTVELSGKKFKIIGILKEGTQTIGGGGPNTGSIIFIPKDAFRNVFKIDSPTFVFVKTLTKEQVGEAKAKIERYLEKKYGEKIFQVNTAEQVLERLSEVLKIVSIFLVGIAAISLLVGGVGIMSTMVTAVLERTREIGTLKAIGATDTKILTMFIIEAGMIGLIGGVVGSIVGFGVSEIVARIGQASGINLRAVISPQLLLGVLVFSMVVGMISGFYPARHAARLDPAEALRYE